MRIPKIASVAMRVSVALFIGLPTLGALGQANYDESKIPAYTLPDPLIMEDGSSVRSRKDWEERRRPEIFGLFEREMYGSSPGKPDQMRFKVTSEDRAALGGKATRREVAITLGHRDKTLTLHLLIYRPNHAPGQVPAFLGMNFKGNHTVLGDSAIAIRPQQTREGMKTPDESTRGNRSARWQVEKIVSRGYALATLYYGDVDPDFDDDYRYGIHPLFSDEKPGPTEWGSIAGWAWGLSRVMDYLESDSTIGKVAVMGHSRLGKTALWAGAMDQRFAIVISNNSGCGGAALSRRRFGESVQRINTSFPHWFCGNFKKYNHNENEQPVDQHMLVALAAPRPVYVASAVEDRWADPRGEFLAAKNAASVYALYGLKGLGVAEMPAVDQPVGDTIGYHVRSGRHDVKEYDWEQYLSFADRHLKK